MYVRFLKSSIELRILISSCPVSLGTCAAFIIGDTLVLLVTWFKTAQLYREVHHLGIKAPLATLLFRDGESAVSAGTPFEG